MFYRSRGTKNFQVCYIYSICEGLNSFFSSETQKKICLMVLKKPCLPPFLKDGHSWMTWELKPRMGKLSLLVPKWNTMISSERQGLETSKSDSHFAKKFVLFAWLKAL